MQVDPDQTKRPDREDRMAALMNRTRAFLRGEQLAFAEAQALWKECRDADELSLARAVLARLRHDESALIDEVPRARLTRDRLCTDEAQLTSKDPECASSVRHDRALAVLAKEFDISSPTMDGRAEILGVAGGIHKRRWQDLGQLGDLKKAIEYYERGGRSGLGEDAYCQVNEAFLNDVLAVLGDDAENRQARARETREHILSELPAVDTLEAASRWWNAASRAEAFFGLRRYPEAKASLMAVAHLRPTPWQLQSTVRQLGHLAQLQHEQPLKLQQVVDVFDAIVPGNADAACSAVIGKVGLALSGGGFRASFYHLGVLARLAELDVLRHVSVLSCVSGGSIVGACYWLMLRERLTAKKVLTQHDYVDLVKDLIRHLSEAVEANLRGQIQPSKASVAWRLLQDERGALDPERAAEHLSTYFYGPLTAHYGHTTGTRVCMHDLEFQPLSHQSQYPSTPFHPGKHNWLRADKVPVLVLNATAVNTGHAWQFTPTWMGESPWSVHEAADSIPRLEWAWYTKGDGWTMELARAVAASACVPGVFAPLEIAGVYSNGAKVRLVDGGVHDNQGTVALLAQDCNVVLVSDACGQLMFEKEDKPGLKGLAAYGNRSMNILMERIRVANYSDLAARKRVGLLGGLMFLHMKAGLDADVVRRVNSQESFALKRAVLTPSGVRKDFQMVLAELRTDLDMFSEVEQAALMACGYQMAKKAMQRDLGEIRSLTVAPVEQQWPFRAMLQEITSTEDMTPRRIALLATLAEGSSVRL